MTSPLPADEVGATGLGDAARQGGARSGRAQRVKLRGGVLDVGFTRNGAGTPLVLVHGAESDRTQFATLVAELGPDIETICYDQRDSGTSRNLAAPYSVGDLADDLVELLNALQLDRAYLLGTSYGGAIAQHAALRHPGRVAGLVLVSTTPSIELHGDGLTRLLSLPLAERPAAMDELLFTEASRRQGAGAHHRRTPGLSERTPEESERRMLAIAAHDVRDRLAKLAVPTLVLHGTDDEIFPLAAGRLIAREVPGAELRTVEGRHGIATEFPRIVAAHTREFLERSAGRLT